MRVAGSKREIRVLYLMITLLPVYYCFCTNLLINKIELNQGPRLTAVVTRVIRFRFYKSLLVILALEWPED